MYYPCRIWKPVKGRLRVQLTYAPDNRRWLTQVNGRRPRWDADAIWWELARSHFMDLVFAAVLRYDEVQVVIDGHSGERCDTRCQNARGPDCVCSCAGQYHGGGLLDHFKLIGDTTLVGTEVVRKEYVVSVNHLMEI